MTYLYITFWSLLDGYRSEVNKHNLIFNVTHMSKSYNDRGCFFYLYLLLQIYKRNCKRSKVTMNRFIYIDMFLVIWRGESQLDKIQHDSK